jgi:hypothetical protein
LRVWAFVTRSSPFTHAWTRSLSRAVRFPTPLSAACGKIGLMAGPSRSLPIGIYRVRPLRPVRTPPAGSGSPDAVRTRLQFPLSRVCTSTTGTAPAFGRPLAPRYGSDLLPLRLPSLLQRGDPVLRNRPSEEVDGLCLGPLSPRRRDFLARPARASSRAFWRGRPAGNRAGVLVCAVATETLWGDCVGARVETPRGPDSARHGF